MRNFVILYVLDNAPEEILGSYSNVEMAYKAFKDCLKWVFNGAITEEELDHACLAGIEYIGNGFMTLLDLTHTPVDQAPKCHGDPDTYSDTVSG